MKIIRRKLWLQGGCYGDTSGIYYSAKEIEECLGYRPGILSLSLSSQSFCGSWMVALAQNDWPGNRHYLLTNDYPSPCSANAVTPAHYRAVQRIANESDEFGFRRAYMELCDWGTKDHKTILSKNEGYVRFPEITFRQWKSAMWLIAHYNEEPIDVYFAPFDGGLCMSYSNIHVFIQRDGRRCS